MLVKLVKPLQNRTALICSKDLHLLSAPVN